ncbi:hypothetical protein Ddye_005662 [Dipteronia dyeriana]|uniref:HAT C-terminal dimerisation domain-containing protein n=1 Tax=Dipteronia dyeriana TaxID=168575 RepID=A0AAD9XGP6_9ROSI|nr:hypothetical protein Ddye_005662 [Dipteronia dyeriana]
MTSESGSGSGSGSGNGVRDIPPRHSVSRIGKGRMLEPDPVQPDNIGFDDTAYHEFLQRQAYLESLNYPVNLDPPLIVSEPNSSLPTSGLAPCAITALKNTSGLNLEDTAHIGSILRPVIQQNLPRGMHNLKFPGDDDVNKFDILYWWREHQKHFPILSIIAKQILATPVSTVAVEQEFSAGGNICDARRSLLSP